MNDNLIKIIDVFCQKYEPAEALDATEKMSAMELNEAIQQLYSGNLELDKNEIFEEMNSRGFQLTWDVMEKGFKWCLKFKSITETH